MDKKQNTESLITPLSEALRLLGVGVDDAFKIVVRGGGFEFVKNQFCSVGKLPPYFDITRVFVYKIEQRFSCEDGEFLYFVFICAPCDILLKYDSELEQSIIAYKKELAKRVLRHKKVSVD